MLELHFILLHGHICLKNTLSIGICTYVYFCEDTEGFCGDPPTVPHSTIDGTAPPYKEGTPLLYICNPGYYLEGSPYSRCLRGIWDGPIMACRRKSVGKLNDSFLCLFHGVNRCWLCWRANTGVKDTIPSGIWVIPVQILDSFPPRKSGVGIANTPIIPAYWIKGLWFKECIAYCLLVLIFFTHRFSLTRARWSSVIWKGTDLSANYIWISQIRLFTSHCPDCEDIG